MTLNKGFRYAVLALALAACCTASATVLTFGPAIAPTNCVPGDVPMPAGYGGFTWDSNFYVVSNCRLTNYYDNTYGAPSGGAAFNAFGKLSVQTTSGTLFDFNGADFSTLANHDAFAGFSSTTIKVDGYDGATLIGTATMNLSATGFTFLNANLNGVDRLVFTSSGSGKWWLMDNFTYNAVPEPATLGMLAVGLIGIAGTLRRKLHR